MKNETITTQLTNKHLKLQWMLSKLAMFFGLLMVVVGVNADSKQTLVLGCMTALIGIVSLTITRIRIWWNHK